MKKNIKVSIAISDDSAKRIIEDAEKLHISKWKNREVEKPTRVKTLDKGGKTFSGILNDIIWNYYRDSEASINCAVERKRQELKNTIWKRVNKTIDCIEGIEKRKKDEIKEKIEKDIIDSEIDEYRQQLLDKYLRKIDRYNSNSIEIRLSNAITEEKGIQEEVGNYKGMKAKYFHALIEDFAQQSDFVRQEVYCRDIIKNIRLTQKNLDKVTSKGKGVENKDLCKVTIVNSGAENSEWFVKPYRFCTKEEAEEPHLICFTSYDTIGEKYYLQAIPINSIKKIEKAEYYIGDGDFNRDAAIFADKLLSPNHKKPNNLSGLFCNGNIETTIVLTEKGMQRYEETKVARPPYFEKNPKGAGTELRFYCPIRQFVHYFSPFFDENDLVDTSAMDKGIIAYERFHIEQEKKFDEEWVKKNIDIY